ncbi:MAG: ABC transporter substrate-binding protein [Caldilineaceae bacterium]|nr:ABC transporter substrate-binding protein [Caldilineaceae bacterium]
MQRLIALLMMLALLAACTTPTTAPTTAPAPAVEAPAAEATPAETPQDAASELPLVRVGHVPVTIYAPLFVAVEKGYFEEEGMRVELLPVEGGTDNVVQVSAGNFDVAGGGIGAGMLNAVARGIEFEIVAPLHTERPPLTSPLVVSKARYDSGELTTVADLAGKKVSTNSKGAATEYWLWRALQQGGLDFPDVEVLGVGFRDVPPALESGSLDAAILGEPLATLAEDQGLITRLSQDFIDGFTSTVIYYNKEWSTANPELAAGFVKAYIRGARDLNGDAWYDPENLAIIEKYTGVPAEVVERANRSYHDPNGAVPLEDMMELQRFFASEGQLSFTEPIDMSQFVNTSYAEAAVEELGGPVDWE